MKILVTVKRVPDPESSLKVAADGASWSKDNVKFVVNPFDEIAIEEGLRLKDKVAESEVVLMTSANRRPRSSSAPGSRWEPIVPFWF